MWRCIAAGLIAFGATLAAMDGAQQPPVNRPSRDWKRFTAVGLEVVGNARDADLKAAARNIAAFRSTLEALMPGLQLAAPEPTTLIVFRDHPSFTEFAPRDGRGRRQMHIAGYFSDAPDRKYLVLPIFSDRRATYEVALHEYTHYVVSHYLRDIPAWLSEGLAEFYSTFELDDEGRAIVGRVPQSRVWTLSTEKLRPLKALIGIDSGSGRFGSTDINQFYAQSWLFVHFMTLSDGGKRQGQIIKYLELLTETKSAEAAAREAFGTTLEALDRDLSRYIEGFQLRGIRVSGIRSVSPEAAIEPLTEAEVAETKARLLIELNVPVEAERYASRATALDPDHVRGRITAARLASMQGRSAEAIGELEKISAANPQSFDAQYHLGRALYEGARYADAIGAFNRALKASPRSTAPWLQLSLAAMALGQYDQSDSAMAQLQHLRWTPRWHYARAYEALKLGRYDAVPLDAKAYIESAGIADESSPYAAFLGAVAAQRTARRADASALLSLVRPALPAKSWTLAITDFLDGRLSASDFLDRARDDGERTEARTYLALHQISAGQVEDARKHLQWVKEKGDRNYMEYELAIAELKRLEAEGSGR